jgi:hypothetical protein
MVQVVTANDCGNMLSVFLGSRASAESAKELAKEVGYNDSPLFGAKKKRVALISELVMFYSALVIFASNRIFNQTVAKSVVDAFLLHAKGRVFSHLEKELPSFSSIYAARLEEYFPIFHQDKAPLGLSFALMKHLGLDPMKNLEGQLWLARQIGMTLDETLEILRGLRVSAPGIERQVEDDQDGKERMRRATDEFMGATSHWEGKDKLTAITIIGAALEGNSEAIAPLIQDLTLEQARIVRRFLEQL